MPALCQVLANERLSLRAARLGTWGLRRGHSGVTERLISDHLCETGRGSHPAAEVRQGQSLGRRGTFPCLGTTSSPSPGSGTWTPEPLSAKWLSTCLSPAHSSPALCLVTVSLQTPLPSPQRISWKLVNLIHHTISDGLVIILLMLYTISQYSL